jgi:hypothetical protein
MSDYIEVEQEVNVEICVHLDNYSAEIKEWLGNSYELEDFMEQYLCDDHVERYISDQTYLPEAVVERVLSHVQANLEEYRWIPLQVMAIAAGLFEVEEVEDNVPEKGFNFCFEENHKAWSIGPDALPLEEARKTVKTWADMVGLTLPQAPLSEVFKEIEEAVRAISPETEKPPEIPTFSEEHWNNPVALHVTRVDDNVAIHTGVSMEELVGLLRDLTTDERAAVLQAVAYREDNESEETPDNHFFTNQQPLSSQALKKLGFVHQHDEV